MNRALAACKDDPDRQYADQNSSGELREARKTCARCPIRGACLTEAVQFGEEWGVWGGLTPTERQRYAAGRPVRRCDRCRLRFVPTTDAWTRCNHCAQQGRGDTSPALRWQALAGRRADVELLAGAGATDAKIARALGVSAAVVFQARKHWGIPSGYRLARGAARVRVGAA